jgi:hypothetical protein
MTIEGDDLSKDAAWQRVSNGVYVCVWAHHPAFSYIVERRRDGRWIIRCPDGSILHNARDAERACRTARGAVQHATSDGLDSINFFKVEPKSGPI